MRAIRVHRFGGPETLAVEDIDRPEPRDDKLLIRVLAASVNPVDYKIRRGGYARVPEAALPVTLGRDLCGVVETAGGGFEAGEEVYAFLDWADGGYADYTLCVPAGMARKPKSLDIMTAAGVPLAATTAWQGLFDHGGLEAGQRVLIHAASGAVGGFAVQFAKAKGAEVVATASGEGVQIARDFGADVVVDYAQEKFEDAGRDYDLVLDLVGGETQDRSYALVKEGGALMSAVQPLDEERLKERSLKGLRYVAKPDGALLQDIAEKFDAGALKVILANTFPLEQAAEAHRLIEHGHPRGKIVLTVA